METKTKTKSGRSLFALSLAAFVDSSETDSLSILWPFMYPILGLRVGLLGVVLGISDFIRTITTPVWAYLADRFSRKTLLIWITGFWGAWTLGIGFVESYSQLMFVRIMSSLGLAVFNPAAFSLISDTFESNRRGRATGIMQTVKFIGTFTAFGALPLIAESSPEGWRTGFIIMGAASVVTGLIILFLLDEPARGASEPELKDIVDTGVADSYRLKLSDLPTLTRIKSWLVFLVHNSFDGVTIAVMFGWVFTWFDDIGYDDDAFMIIMALYLTALIGYSVFGWLGDKLEERYPDHGRTTFAMVGFSVSVPALLGFFLLSESNITAAFVFGAVMGLCIAIADPGARWPMTQAILLPEIRASGLGVLEMARGIIGAIAVTLSSRLVDLYGVTTMLVIIVVTSRLLATLAWIPLYKTYPVDKANLHEELARRRDEFSRASG